jgi:hypothetical protein
MSKYVVNHYDLYEDSNPRVFSTREDTIAFLKGELRPGDTEEIEDYLCIYNKYYTDIVEE